MERNPDTATNTVLRLKERNKSALKRTISTLLDMGSTVSKLRPSHLDHISHDSKFAQKKGHQLQGRMQHLQVRLQALDHPNRANTLDSDMSNVARRSPSVSSARAQVASALVTRIFRRANSARE